jgi:RNA polymerase sigma-B factor
VVAQLARRYRGRGADLDELRQVGYVGLMKAINGYEIDRGDLMPYAVTTILGEIKRYFRDRCWAIRPTRRVQELEMRLTSARADLEQHLGRNPTVGELAESVGEDPDDVAVAAQANTLFHLLSTDAPTRETQSYSLGETVGYDDRGYAQAEAGAMVRTAVAECGLSEREREILAMRFFDDLTQREIAKRVGTTQMQVSRILTRVMAALREKLGPID